jgi:hypothetical protein
LQGRSISGALKYAVDQINNCTGVLPDVELDFIYNDTQVIKRASTVAQRDSGTGWARKKNPPKKSKRHLKAALNRFFVKFKKFYLHGMGHHRIFLYMFFCLCYVNKN